MFSDRKSCVAVEVGALIQEATNLTTTSFTALECIAVHSVLFTIQSQYWSSFVSGKNDKTQVKLTHKDNEYHEDTDEHSETSISRKYMWETKSESK